MSESHIETNPDGTVTINGSTTDVEEIANTILESEDGKAVAMLYSQRGGETCEYAGDDDWYINGEFADPGLFQAKFQDLIRNLSPSELVSVIEDHYPDI